MNELNKQALMDRLLLAQYATGVNECWHAVEQSITQLAGSQYDNMLNTAIPGGAFKAWWYSCCELLGGRQVVIKSVNFDGPNGVNDESIALFNHGPMIVDISGWRINADNEKQDVVFPQGMLMKPDTGVRIDTVNQGEVSFNRRRSVWNNKGDQALLFDRQGTLISSWIYGIKAHDEVEISHIQFDGKIKGSEVDECAQIINLGSSWVDIAGWQLSAGEHQPFIFPKGARLCPKGEIRVYTDLIEHTTGGYSFNSKRVVWNNKGGTGRLTDHQGKPVSSLSYGDKA